MSERTPSKKKPKAAVPRVTESLEVPANFLERVSPITGGSASLVTVFGEGKDKTYLVPFVDVTISEAVGEDTTELLGSLMPLESAVYIVAMLSGDLADAVEQYESIANTKAGPEASRFNAIVDYVEKAQVSLSQLRDTVARLTSSSAT